MTDSVKIIGAGLAGPEAAWQCARRGIAVELFEMRPGQRTPAHETGDFAELVCSNSLKSDAENTAPWLLKEEMRRGGSLLMEMARLTAVPAGHALAVDRLAFARAVTDAIEREPLVTIHREEVTAVEEDSAITVIASGPLTSHGLAGEIERLALDEDDAGGAARLYFYDSISPIVEADSIDMEKVYRAARYDKGSADYINCPMNREEYERFLDALIAAQSVATPEWETTPPDATDGVKYFEGCLPIEEIARRGRDTLRFGPMKPVGLRDPRSGKIPYAVVQLRQENLRADSYNLVGFQNHLRFGEQAQVLRLIPGLGNAHFLRYGQIHRNTYINAPTLLLPTGQMKRHPRVLFAGQISGVEGYVEVDCHRTTGRHRRRRPGCRRATGGAAAPNRPGLADALYLPRRSPQLSAGQHHFRPVAAARRSNAAQSSRQEGAPPHGVRAGAGRTRRVDERNSPQGSGRTYK